MNKRAYILTLADVASEKPAYLETVFSLANGHFGVRAGDLLTQSDTAATIVNGFYETAPIQYGESAFGYAKNHQTILPLPDLRLIRISDEQGHLFRTQSIVSKSLDMRTGELCEAWDVRSTNDRHLRVSLSSVLMQPAGNNAVLRYRVESLDYTGVVNFQKEFKQVASVDASDDPRQARRVDSLSVEIGSPSSEMQSLTAVIHCTHQQVLIQPYSEVGLHFSRSMVPGKLVNFQIVTEVSEVTDVGVGKPSDLSRFNVDKEINKTKAYWHAFWNRSAIDIVDDDILNRAIHYNLFQLASSAGQDGKTNIAAKGLTGTGYEGHYFWDTEMYMLPFFTFTSPAIAKKLLQYRASILPQAKDRARVMGIKKGALFAWRTINGEEASAYYPAGTAQYHIDADIAFAVNRYYSVTNDREFMAESGLELVVETARLWSCFGSYTGEGSKRRFELFDVTGPDEYTAIVNNNYYTNRMAKFNLELADRLIRQFPGEAAKLGVTDEEANKWQEAAEAMYLPFNDDYQINAQDDSSLSKPLWPFDDTPKDHYPLLLHYHPLDIYRHQVNKQADTLLADYLFNDMNVDQLRRDYNYYEKITTHDSSLSRSIFSALAARLGDGAKAYSYFMDTVRMDLTDMQGNAADGLHIANLGGSWLSIACGFGGITLRGGLLNVDNRLPKGWREMRIRIQFQNRLLNLHYTQIKTEVSLLDGQPIDIVINGNMKRIRKSRGNEE